MQDQSTESQRFWANVFRTEHCWLWTRSLATNGYGRITLKGRFVQAHRFSWELHHGAIPEGLVVCHTCDVRHCVRPDHLFVGTQLENILDSLRKQGAPPCGCTFDPIAVAESRLALRAAKRHSSPRPQSIRHEIETMTTSELRASRFALGVTQAQFADLLGVTQPTLSSWERGMARISPYRSMAIQSLLSSMGVADLPWYQAAANRQLPEYPTHRLRH